MPSDPGPSDTATAEHLFQWREGLLDARIWHGLEAPVDDILAYPGVQNWWTTRSGWYSEDFRIFIRGKIASASSPTTLFTPVNRRNFSSSSSLT